VAANHRGRRVTTRTPFTPTPLVGPLSNKRERRSYTHPPTGSGGVRTEGHRSLHGGTVPPLCRCAGLAPMPSLAARWLRARFGPPLRHGRFASGRLAAVCCVSVVLSPWAVCATPTARYGHSIRAAETRTSASPDCNQKTASWIAPGADERAAVLDAIAEQVADAIWADLTGDSEGYGWFPTGKTR
jgi:hypothetical protein